MTDGPRPYLDNGEDGPLTVDTNYLNIVSDVMIGYIGQIGDAMIAQGGNGKPILSNGFSYRSPEQVIFERQSHKSDMRPHPSNVVCAIMDKNKVLDLDVADAVHERIEIVRRSRVLRRTGDTPRVLLTLAWSAMLYLPEDNNADIILDHNASTGLSSVTFKNEEARTYGPQILLDGQGDFEMDDKIVDAIASLHLASLIADKYLNTGGALESKSLFIAEDRTSRADPHPIAENPMTKKIDAALVSAYTARELIAHTLQGWQKALHPKLTGSDRQEPNS